MGFEEFVAQRLEGLLRYATVLTGDPHLAEDVTQDVLLRAQSRWARIAAAERPELYVRRMILNEYLSWRRRRASTTFPVEQRHLDSRAPDGIQPVDDRDAVLGVLATLPKRQRAVVVLRYYEDLPDQDIADLLGCRPATVRSLAARAFAALREAGPDVRLIVRGAE